MTEHAGSRDHGASVTTLIDTAPWSMYQKLSVLLIALAVLIDGFDNQILALALPVIAREWSVAPASFAPALSAGLAGMMVGSAFAGALGDRFGRRPALIGSLLLFGTMTIAIAFVPDPMTMAVARLIAGLGLGSAMPNASALVAELTPARRRTLAVTLATVCSPVGSVAAGLAGGFILPVTGWRMLFIGGGVTALAVAAISVAMLAESPQFLARQAAWHLARRVQLDRLMARMRLPAPAVRSDVAAAEPQSSGGLAVVLAPTHRRDTILLWIASFANMLALFALISWLPSLLATAGYSIRAASLGLTAFSVGGIAGSLVGSRLIDRIGSRGTLGGMAVVGGTIGSIIALLPLGPQFPLWALVAVLAAVGTCAGGFNVLLYPLALNLYPTTARATGLGLNLSIGRLAAIASPFVAVALARAGGPMAFFAGYALCLLIAAGSVIAIRRHVMPIGR